MYICSLYVFKTQIEILKDRKIFFRKYFLIDGFKIQFYVLYFKHGPQYTIGNSILNFWLHFYEKQTF